MVTLRVYIVKLHCPVHNVPSSIFSSCGKGDLYTAFRCSHYLPSYTVSFNYYDITSHFFLLKHLFFLDFINVDYYYTNIQRNHITIH